MAMVRVKVESGAPYRHTSLVLVLSSIFLASVLTFFLVFSFLSLVAVFPCIFLLIQKKWRPQKDQGQQRYCKRPERKFETEGKVLFIEAFLPRLMKYLLWLAIGLIVTIILAEEYLQVATAQRSLRW